MSADGKLKILSLVLFYFKLISKYKQRSKRMNGVVHVYFHKGTFGSIFFISIIKMLPNYLDDWLSKEAVSFPKMFVKGRDKVIREI